MITTIVATLLGVLVGRALISKKSRTFFAHVWARQETKDILIAIGGTFVLVPAMYLVATISILVALMYADQPFYPGALFVPAIEWVNTLTT